MEPEKPEPENLFLGFGLEKSHTSSLQYCIVVPSPEVVAVIVM